MITDMEGANNDYMRYSPMTMAYLAQLPSGALILGFPFKVNQPNKGARFSHGHWASELAFLAPVAQPKKHRP